MELSIDPLKTPPLILFTFSFFTLNDILQCQVVIYVKYNILFSPENGINGSRILFIFNETWQIFNIMKWHVFTVGGMLEILSLPKWSTWNKQYSHFINIACVFLSQFNFVDKLTILLLERPL